ncbi:hypothetical protein LWP59_04160 [Amycolatopsis acidiphila]|uniref:hypothetical protein n=1 Tax=Amycolatopsis acidiphila TaxID=715473 RepID=UPI001643C702|nr:hypothetical protein [Amycolatopsis acidiphila]UIJ60874.1 hypothetical protein LWP59_04160 [Amycolatopsis acidiphila]
MRQLTVHGAEPPTDLVRLRPLTGVRFELFDVTDHARPQRAAGGGADDHPRARAVS